MRPRQDQGLVICFVAAGHKSCPIWLRFFRPYRANELAVCDVTTSITREVAFLDELDRVGAFNTATDTVSKAAELVSRR